MLIKRNMWLIGLLLVVMTAVACGDDPPAGSASSDTGADTGLDLDDDDGRITPDTDITDPNQPHLVLLTEPSPSVSFSSAVPVRVQFVDGQSNPVPDAFLTFTALTDTADSTLSNRNAATDAEGIAETTIQGGVQQVDFILEVAVFEDDAVPAIQLEVSVQPKDQSDYIIRVNYGGPVPLNEVEVLLFDAENLCDNMVAHWEDTPSEDTAWTSLQMLPDAEGNIVERGLNVPNAVQFHYAIARGEPVNVNDAGTGLGYYSTWGCVDMLPDPDPSSATIITIDMTNLWPDTEGTYELTSEINLIDALPDNVQDIVEIIGEIFSSPSIGILRLVAVALAGDGEEYWESTIGGFLFEYCTGSGSPSVLCEFEGDVVPTTIAAGIAATLDDLLLETLLPSLGGVGDTIADIFNIGNNIFENAENFQLSGTLRLNNHPDRTGYLGDTHSIIFNQIAMLWQGPDDDEATYRNILLTGEPIRADGVEAAVVFHPDEDAEYAIVISPYGLTINYGEIILFIIEKIVLPSVIDPSVNSFGDLITYFIDCEDLGETVADAIGLGGLSGAVESACDALVITAEDAIRGWIGSLSVDASNYYLMGTPNDDPCRVGFGASSEFEVQTMGADAAADRCQWAGEIRFSSGDASGDDVRGNWFSIKL